MIDGDVLLYRTGFSAEEAIEDPPDSGYWTWHCDTNKVKIDIKNSLDFLLDKLEADDYVITLSDEDNNFRRSLSPDYKARRKRVKRPLALKPMRQHVLDEYKAIVYKNLEGDDVLGILQTSNDKDTIIVSIDKDMKTIPGKFYKDTEMLEITEAQADYYHLFQTVIGDSTDGYKGIPGIGAERGKKLLGSNPTWHTVVSLYNKHGLTEEYALNQARMARILRYGEYDFLTQQPILWTPK